MLWPGAKNKYAGLYMKKKNGMRGFTLFEIMIVIAVMAIVAAIATPLLLSALPEMNLKSAARDIYSAVNETKAEALKRGVNVTLLFNPPANSYLIFLDNGAGGGTANDGIVNGTEPTILTTTALPRWVSFDPAVSGTGVSYANNALVFSPQGIPVIAATGLSVPAPLTVGLRAVSSSGAVLEKRTITVSVAGGINMQ